MIDVTQITRRREALGLSLKQFAEAIGVHFLTVARMEKGTARVTEAQSAVMEQVLRDAPEEPRVSLSVPLTTPGHPLTSIPSSPAQFVHYSEIATLTTPDLDHCAQALFDWMCTLDPVWGDRLRVMKEERGFTTLQAVSTCIAYVLENALHMVIVKHDALEPSPWRRGEKMECPQCHTEYKPTYPGQPFCGNSCADQYRSGRTEAVPAPTVALETGSLGAANTAFTQDHSIGILETGTTVWSSGARE